MKKSRITLIILFAVLGILLLLYFIFNSQGNKYQWFESYNASSDQPYGTLFIKKLLKSNRSAFSVNEKKSLQVLLDSNTVKPNTDYVFIGQSIYLDDQDVEALARFINNGNNAFISSLEMPHPILTRIYHDECDYPLAFTGSEDSIATLNFYHPSLNLKKGYSFAYRFIDKDRPYHWTALNSAMFCDSTKNIVPLGYNEPDKVNFFKIQYGKGNLYIHTNPLVFTNYFVAKPDKIDYAAGVFSHLTGNALIWDEYSKIPFTGNNNAYDSPLYYILQQPSLKYAWWMLLFSIVLYVCFTAKRTQRVLPVLEVKTNTSLEYINLIASLHFQNGNHLDMAQKKMKYFLYFIRARYGIHAHQFTETHMNRLAEKSKVNITDVQAIFSQYNLIERDSHYNIEANRLVNFYHSIEYFYKHCK